MKDKAQSSTKNAFLQKAPGKYPEMFRKKEYRFGTNIAHTRALWRSFFCDNDQANIIIFVSIVNFFMGHTSSPTGQFLHFYASRAEDKREFYMLFRNVVRRISML